MKKTLLVLVLLTSVVSTASAGASSAQCITEAKTTLLNSIKAFGISRVVKVDNLDAAIELTNSYNEKVLKYELPAIQIDENSYIPESSASVVLRKDDCQVLKTSVDAFSGLN